MEEGTVKDKSEDIRGRFMSKMKDLSVGNIDQPLTNEHWSPLLFACSLGDLSCVKYVVDKKDADKDRAPEGRISPKMTPVHMCALHNEVDIVKCVISPSNVNAQDQWGFSPLHYAVVYQSREVIRILLQNGADASLKSTSGNTAIALSQVLNYTDIADMLASSVRMKEDPSAPSFRKWLQFCGAGAYISSFFEAGYDLGFIAKHGLTEVDLDCIGIPRKMRGVWRKLEGLHKIEEFIDKEEAESEAEDTDESDPEDSSDADSD